MNADARPCDDALWLPNGSVRAIIAISLVVGALALLFSHIDVPEWFVVIATNAVTFYFTSNQSSDMAKQILAQIYPTPNPGADGAAPSKTNTP